MAELKITELDELTTPAAADLLEIVDDVAGTPTSKKVTLENIYKHLAIGSDADGDIYYRASGVLARHPKGTANHKLFMHASNDAPEWAKGMGIISSTRDLTAAAGDVSYSGLGFKPSLVLGFGAVGATIVGCIGVDDGTVRKGMDTRTTAGQWAIQDYLLAFLTSVGVYQAAVVKSFDSDGVTLTWTKVGSPAGTATFTLICFR